MSDDALLRTPHGIRYLRRGDAGGIPLLLVHGIGRSLDDWEEAIDALGATRTVYAIDLPGFGYSRRLPGDTTLEGLADAVLAFLDDLGIDQAHLVGNSLGGAVIMRVAVTSPERAASLALVDSAGFGRSLWLAMRLLSLRPLRPVLLNTGRISALVTVRAIVHDRAFVTAQRVAATRALVRQPDFRTVFAEIARYLGDRHGVHESWRRELLAQVQQLRIPMLIVWGDRDVILPFEHYADALRALPDARAHVFAGAGHMPQIEQAEAFVAVLEGFLADERR